MNQDEKRQEKEIEEKQDEKLEEYGLNPVFKMMFVSSFMMKPGF